MVSVERPEGPEEEPIAGPSSSSRRTRSAPEHAVESISPQLALEQQLKISQPPRGAQQPSSRSVQQPQAGPSSYRARYEEQPPIDDRLFAVFLEWTLNAFEVEVKSNVKCLFTVLEMNASQVHHSTYNFTRRLAMVIERLPSVFIIVKQLQHRMVAMLTMMAIVYAFILVDMMRKK
jgi:hypothetical protein